MLQALAEADRVRPAITSPTFLEKDVAHTQELVGAKRLAAEDAARCCIACLPMHFPAALARHGQHTCGMQSQNDTGMQLSAGLTL